MITKNGIEEKIELKQIPYSEYEKLKEEFAEKQNSLQERLWLDATIAQFDNLLRLNYSKSIEDFTKIVLQSISEETNAFRGVFYVFEKDKNICRAVASYACVIDKIEQQMYRIGEGMIGQAADSKKMIYFDDLPSKSLDFNVISVKINAANILVLPLVFNDEVCGVLELLYIKSLEEKYLTLLQTISKNIASMMESIVKNAMTKELLMEAQMQTEKLTAQEEELRQNMEELQTTQDEMFAKQTVIDAQLNAIDNSTIIRAEFSPEGLILDANPTFFELFGYTIEEVKNKHHSILVEKDYAKSPEYQQFWENLRAGESQPGEYIRVMKNGEKVWMNATYSPVFDREGKIQKILKIAVDITETKNLLIESQLQTEQLTAQEEELRQNMEELQTTQDEMFARQTVLDAQMTALDNSTIIRVEFTPEGYILDANPTFFKLFGYAMDEVKNKHHSMLVEKEYAKSPEYKQFWENLRAGKSQPGEYIRVMKNGEKVWMNATYSPILDKGGNIQKILKIAVDITETKNLLMEAQMQTEKLTAQEEELRQNMEELQTTQDEMFAKQTVLDAQLNALDNSTIIRVEFSPEGYILDANPTFFKLFGYSIEEVKNKHHSLLVEKEYANSPEYQQFWENLRAGKSQPGEYIRIMKNGEKVWMNATYSPVFDREGKIQKILKIAVDITETKNLLFESQMQTEKLTAQEEELRQNMEELQTTQDEMFTKQTVLDAQLNALDNSTIIRVEFSPEGFILDANPTFFKLFGYSMDEVKNKHHSILVEKEYAKSPEYQQFWENLRAGKSQPGEYIRVMKNGEKVWMNATYSPVFDKEGKIQKILKIAVDITETKKLLINSQLQTEELTAQEEELRQNMEELQSTQDELQRQFGQVESLKRDLDARMNVFDLTTILSESDLKGNILFVNQKLIDVSQYKEEELLGKAHNMLRHPDMPKAVFKKFWETIQAGKIFRGIIKNRKKDGSHYWVDAVVSPVMDENNKPVKYIGVRYLIEEDALAEKLYDKMLREMGIE